MREIKYRGKSLEDGKWIYGDILQSCGQSYICSSYTILDEFIQAHAIEVDTETVGQYTGLNDKNGKQIYEGDIVKCVSELYTNFGETPTGRYATDFYEILVKTDDSYCFGSRKIGRKIGKDYISTPVLKICAEKYYEVIGNIYNNPELLEVQNAE